MKRALFRACAACLSLAVLLSCGFFADPARAEPITVKQLDAGIDFSLALFSDGSLWAWGVNDQGQLGDGTGAEQASPVYIGGGFTAVSAGSRHVLALKGDSLYAWGSNALGQLGVGMSGKTLAFSKEPKLVGKGYAKIAAGYYHSMAIKENGELFTWGCETSPGAPACLGNGNGGGYTSPRSIGTGYTEIAGGYNYSLALKGDKLYRWGALDYWDYNPIGDPQSSASYDIYTPEYFDSGFTAISAGSGHALALKGDAFYGWGDRRFASQLSFNSEVTNGYLKPRLFGTGYSAIDASYNISLVLKGSTLYGCGSNYSGQLTSNVNYYLTIPSMKIREDVKLFAAGSSHVVVSDGVNVYQKGQPYPCEREFTKQNFVWPVTSVSISQTSASLNPGDSVMLTATAAPENAANKNINWTTTNPSVASVSGGIVTAMGVGTATITAASESNLSVKATCTVTVSPPPVPVSGIQLNKTEISLKVGESLTLSVTVSPSNATDKSVSWSSNDPSVATVSAGKITAKAPGSALILAASVSTPEKMAMCIVNVADAAHPPEGGGVTAVALSSSSLSLRIGGTAKLTAAVEPNDAVDRSVAWTTSDSSVATVSGGKVTAKGKGDAVITAVSLSNPEKSATCTVRVTAAPVRSILALQKTVYLEKGATAKLTPVPVTSDNSKAALKWKTSNKKIITVDKNGKVKAVKAGKATITATADNGKSVKITVISGKGKPATSLTIKNPPKKKTIKAGSSLKLKIAFKPADAQGVIAFKSKSPKVVSVDGAGQLKALKKGSSTITVTMGKKKTTLKITVK